MKLHRTVLLALACALPAVGFAQWQWVDNSGRKVFSDQPPPADIPAKNIVKRPGGGVAASAPAASASAGTGTAAVSASAKPAGAASAAKLSGKDKELEDKKRQAEAAEEAKKKAEDDRVAKAKAENCTRARQAKVTFDSGARVGTVNAKGEREFMDDAQKASEAKRLQGIISSDCK